jgi:ABC-type tungstate transport system substrate-binding protein
MPATGASWGITLGAWVVTVALGMVLLALAVALILALRPGHES